MDRKAFKASSLLQIKQTMHSSLILFIMFIQPILYTCITYFMFRHSGRENFIAYIVLGTGMINLWSVTVYSSASTINRERFIGTLEIISAVPVSFRTIIFGKVTGSVLIGVLSTIFGFAFITLVSGEVMTIHHPMLFLMNYLVVIVSFMGVSMTMAILFALSRQVRFIMNASEFPVYILSGIIFPMEYLPLWTRPLSYILPPTWGTTTLRMCIMGVSNWTDYYTHLTILVGLTLFYFLLSRYLFVVIMRKIRYDGSLGVI